MERAKHVTLFWCSSSALREVSNSNCFNGTGAFQIRTVQSKEPVIKNSFLDQVKHDIESSWALKSSITRQQSISYTILYTFLKKLV